MIKHIWFDFSDTIASVNRDAHNKLRYESYAKVTGKKLTRELIVEYEKLYDVHKKSNASIFKSMGKPAGFWSDVVNSVNPKTFYELTDENIPEVLTELSKIMPVSIFSNINLEKILPALGINKKIFTHILSSSMVGAPKPALDGFKKMIELSKLPPEEILYIGDGLEKDIVPAQKVGLVAGTVLQEIKQADYSFKDFQAILKFIEKENKK